MRMIISKFMNEMNDLLIDKGVRVKLTEAAVDYLIEQGFDPKMGARPLNRKINDLIKVPLSKKILFERLGKNSMVMIDYANESLNFDVSSTQLMVQPVIDSNGYIILDGVKS
jgi:ATP-dependent Clp protease ATP-binding subunit ClpA